MNIYSNGKVINLWEAITAASVDSNNLFNKEVTELKSALAKTERYPDQEIVLISEDNGWKILINCPHQGPYDGVEIFIPSNRRENVSIKEVPV